MTEKATATLAAALAELQTQLPRVVKDKTAKVDMKTGGSYRYQYADLADVSEAILPVLGKLGLSFTALPTLVGDRFVLAYELLHVSGESKAGEFPLPSPDRASPQEVGGAITYARRYCLCAMTGVATERDDDDAEAAERAAARRGRRSERPAPAAADEPRITADQQRQMQTLFRTAEISDKAAKLKYAVGVVRRSLTSATELTQDEAGKVIGALERDAEKRNAAATTPGEPDAEAWLATQQPPDGETR